ncbi:MAG TPA: phosphatase PAP2 family protein [Nitrospiraceae bacterium]|nr:phosphatase PAP2 family protein [Nitrospiraceae bacterium]
MLALGQTSSLFLPGVLAFGYWLWLKRKEALIGAAVLGGLFLLGDLLGAQVKHLVGRIRPCHVLTGVQQLSGCGGTFSFPSNHALNTAAAAAFLQVLYPVTGWVTWPLVAVIGFSRVYVGGHYVSDVLGGWVIGGLLGAGTALLLLRWSAFGTKLTRNSAEDSRSAS